jgi:hypothetical protein
VVSFTPWSLYPQGKSPWYTLDRRLDGPQSRSGRGGEEKDFQPLKTLEPLIIQPVAQMMMMMMMMMTTTTTMMMMIIIIIIIIDFNYNLYVFRQ